MRALSEPSLPGQMLFQASLSTPGWAAAPANRAPQLQALLPTFSCPCRAGQSQAQPKPLLSLHRPICEQPRPTGAPPRQDSAGPDGLNVTTLCMALCAGWSSYQTCQPPEPSEPCAHSHVHMEECLSAGLQGLYPHLLVHSCVSSLLLDFGCPPSCHIPSYLVLSPSPSPMW